MMENARWPSLEALPSELVHYILTFLSPVSLAKLSTTSHLLRSYAHDDRLWEMLVRQNVPSQTLLPSHKPAGNWRALHIAHHPYWFLTRHKFWFSDRLDVGGMWVSILPFALPEDSLVKKAYNVIPVITSFSANLAAI